MLILNGVYSFKRKIIAYRNDFCLSCAQPRRAYRIRTFDVIHLFFIPLIPLGFLRRWHCSVCGNFPHVQPGTRRSFKWIGVVILALFTFVIWAVPPKDDPWVWPSRVILPAAMVALLVNAIRSKPPLRLAEKLAEVQPADEGVCPLCSGPLILDSAWHCTVCGVERSVVRA